MRLRNKPEAKGVIEESPFVIHGELPLAGKLAEFFLSDGPFEIEIGTGKGKFLVEMAQRHPETRFLGIERYESVLFRGCRKLEAMEHPPGNVRFLCMDARQITEVFCEGEVARIYLNFSDPWPKARHARRRLTSPEYLAIYRRILKTGGTIEFKTDNRELFEYSLEQFREDPAFRIALVTYDLHRNAELMENNVMTEYERKFSALGNRICKLTAVYAGGQDRTENENTGYPEQTEKEE